LTEPVEFTLGLTDAQPDSMLLAGRYTLLDHEHALQRLMRTAAAHGVDIVIGGPYNSGILAGGTRSEYQTAPAQISAKVARITDIAQRYDAPSRGQRCSSRLLTPPRPQSFPAPASPNASQKTTRRSIPGSPTTSGTDCATNTSSPPTRRCPSTDNPGKLPPD
jgi:D-threo-aldose 1-dehydrogenase